VSLFSSRVKELLLPGFEHLQKQMPMIEIKGYER
jgi:hypothetical protein